MIGAADAQVQSCARPGCVPGADIQEKGGLMSRGVRVCLLVAAVWVSIAIARAAGDSPLVQAVKSGDAAAVRVLAKSRAEVNVPTGDGSTPLLLATHNSDIEIVRALIAAGADVNTPNHYGVTPLLEASRTGDATLMSVLLKAGADPKRAHPEGETPLMAVARAGSVPGVKLLLEQKVDLNVVENVQQTTALMRAAAEGHVDVVDVLLKAGADPNRQAHVTALSERTGNSDHPTGGFTALMWAARNGEEGVVRRLASGGANLNLKNGDGATASMIAIYNDRFDMAAALADLGADVNDGSLYVAVEMRESTTDQFAFDGSRLRPNHPNTRTALDLIKLLLEKGADPNKNFTGQFHSSSMPNSDRFDNTPFYRAALTCDVEALKLLIAHGANLEQSPAAPAAPAGGPAAAGPGRGRGGNPNAGRTAAMVTMSGGRGPQMTGGPGYIRSGAVPYREPGSRKPEDAFVLLIKSGANPNAKGPDGTPLLHQAVQAGNVEMIRALADAEVDFTQTNNAGLTALDVAEGKQPAGAAARGGRGPGGPPPPAAGGGRGRGGRGGAARQDVAKLLRELMGLPPAPVPEAPASPAAGDAAPEAASATGDAQ
jgi:ankyrin repeat protein